VVRDCKHEHVVSGDPVDQVVWKATHPKLPDLATQLGADVGILAQSTNRVLYLDGQTVPKARYPPAEVRCSFGEIILCFEKKVDFRHWFQRR
jgi:hypothetical protein